MGLGFYMTGYYLGASGSGIIFSGGGIGVSSSSSSESSNIDFFLDGWTTGTCAIGCI
jgi:hypothetical protein